MPMFAIAGSFRIVGASPDGDSVRFYPNRRDAFAAARLRVRTNASGRANLRLDAIDHSNEDGRPVRRYAIAPFPVLRSEDLPSLRRRH